MSSDSRKYKVHQELLRTLRNVKQWLVTSTVCLGVQHPHLFPLFTYSLNVRWDQQWSFVIFTAASCLFFFNCGKINTYKIYHLNHFKHGVQWYQVHSHSCATIATTHPLFILCCPVSLEPSLCIWGNSSSVFPVRKSEATLPPALGLGCRPVTQLPQSDASTRTLLQMGATGRSRLGWGHHVGWCGWQQRCPAFGGGSCHDGASQR